MSRVGSAESSPTSPATFAPLRNSTFRSIWFATQVSNLGALMQIVAVGWLMATISTSDLMVALVQASSALPAFILSVFAGAIVDNFNLCERRRAKGRLGARHWTLLRNLQEPSQWTETFRTPTWTDYLHLNHRHTSADKELDERLLELHSGDQPPQMKLSIERPTRLARKSHQAASFLSH